MGKRKDQRKRKKKDDEPIELKWLNEGCSMIYHTPPFSYMPEFISIIVKKEMRKGVAAVVDGQERCVYVNSKYLLSPKEWAYILAHCLFHLAFGHFDAENMPGYEIEDEAGHKQWRVDCDTNLWNIACDIYITKFLEETKIGERTAPDVGQYYSGPLTGEIDIYNYLIEMGFSRECQVFGTATKDRPDMIGLENPITYQENKMNPFQASFSEALALSAQNAVFIASGDRRRGWMDSFAGRAGKWFVNHYPLLGAIASAFEIVFDRNICSGLEISIAAIDVINSKIYVNPTAMLGWEEMKFVLAHEYLHAGLEHHNRCQGRNPYLWNVACDYVINGWLKQMEIGEMPEKGALYDPQFDNVSAEEVYDRIVRDLRYYLKMETLRGYGRGDIFAGKERGFGDPGKAVGLDDFYRNALQEGLEYHRVSGRGFVPAGLIEEIRALAIPPVPWDVKLARWFDTHFAPVDKRRTYSRPSRRQGSTPEIPRPRLVVDERLEKDRTFGVIIDTSGSMSARQIGYALGAVASYSASRDVSHVRVVFCDAGAYDAGYLSAEDIAGRVVVKGRGGTVLQPAVDLLRKADDFPKDGPILLITDGMIESDLYVPGVHAYIVPTGSRLPFRAKGKVFYMTEMKEDE